MNIVTLLRTEAESSSALSSVPFSGQAEMDSVAEADSSCPAPGDQDAAAAFGEGCLLDRFNGCGEF